MGFIYSNQRAPNLRITNIIWKVCDWDLLVCLQSIPVLIPNFYVEMSRIISTKSYSTLLVALQREK
jgi:hypothetical protein